MIQAMSALVMGSALAWAPAEAEPQVQVLISAERNLRLESWEAASKDVAPDCPIRWSIKKQTLHGGKQEGVDVIILDNGKLQVAVCPTRGMGLLWARLGDVRLGWDSPVKETIHPRHVNLQSRGGLGWLEGFNEFVCRCGMEWAGHPGTDRFVNNVGDEATMELTLHGKTANLPASEVEVVMERQAPYRLRVRGRVDERMFYGPKLELWTELSTEPGSNTFRIRDTLTNRGAAEQEFQVIYHANFGKPLLGEGARFVGAVERVTPFNAHAAKGIAEYTKYAGPTLGFIEQVYKIRPAADVAGRSMGMLVNAAGDRAASVSFSVKELPYLTLWKNTNAEGEGYVTGIEPGTGFPHNRHIERSKGRVPKLAAGESRSFTVEFAVHVGAAEVKSATERVAAIQAGRKPQIDAEPEQVAVAAERPDILFAEFEGTTYDPWKAHGTAFGTGPAAGTLPGQMEVSGFKGKRLVNSFHGGDASTGTLVSPDFTIERKYITFLIGGGGYEGKTCVNLVIEGKVVRTATGPNVSPGGSEALAPAAWDVADLQDKVARIEVIDRATGPWGHINLDHIAFTDTKPAGGLAAVSRTRQVIADKQYLHFPVQNGARVRTVKVQVNGEVVREFTIEAADLKADWWASLDVSAWKGKQLTIDAGRLPETSKFIDLIDQDDTLNKAGGDVYRELLRSQFHFSPRRGWNNDPNGLVFYNGEYHLFFQLNPYGTQWGNMHWGHAVSRDLVHWEELGIALYPDRMGPMFSGSAVVDWHNTSGFGKDGKPPLVLIYTAAGDPATQCLAWSLDGRTFTKYERNPVVPQFTPGNRDPKVFWHEPTKRWVMTLYVELPRRPAEAPKKPEPRHTIHFLTSPDLKNWEVTGQIEGLFECPDFFPLAVDGDTRKIKWLLTAASSEYLLGTFDGRTFVPETPKLPGHRGRDFYAAQTFSDIPAADGRRIMIGWLRAPSPGMPFNQAMSVPLQLRLTSTEAGPRLTWAPVRELEMLRVKSHRFGPLEVKPGDDPLRGVSGELLEIHAELTPAAHSTVTFTVRGVPVVYDVAKQELTVAGHRAPAPLREGKLRLTILADRTVFEVFAADGLAYVPVPVIPKAEDRAVSLSVTGSTEVRSLVVHELKSAWSK